MIATVHTAFLSILVFQRIATTLGLKDCIEPIRVSKDEKLACGPEAAFVPTKICHNSDSQCKGQQMEGSDACAVVVEALFAEWRMMDAALLLSGTCQHSIEQGHFSSDDALRVLPQNDELVGVRVSGAELVKVLEEKLVDYYLYQNTTSYPHTAGLRYQFNITGLAGHRVENVELLGFRCDWKPLQGSASYIILTDTSHARNIFPNSVKVSGAKRGIAESFFLYATSVCSLKNNWHQMRVRNFPNVAFPLPLSLPSNPPTQMPQSKTRTISATH